MVLCKWRISSVSCGGSLHGACAQCWRVPTPAHTSLAGLVIGNKSNARWEVELEETSATQDGRDEQHQRFMHQRWQRRASSFFQNDERSGQPFGRYQRTFQPCITPLAPSPSHVEPAPLFHERLSCHIVGMPCASICVPPCTSKISS